MDVKDVLDGGTCCPTSSRETGKERLVPVKLKDVRLI